MIPRSKSNVDRNAGGVVDKARLVVGGFGHQISESDQGSVREVRYHCVNEKGG